MTHRSRGVFAPELCFIVDPPRIQRAQGRPGGRLHPGPRAKRICASAKTTGTGGDHTAFPARWFTAYSVLLCPQNLPECANGRFSQNRPSLDLSPIALKGLEPVEE